MKSQAQLTIEFHGVCVHVRRAPEVDLPDGVEHRVVLIDGRGGRNANGHAIAAHVPRVEVYDESPQKGGPPRASFELDRQHLWIAGAGKGMPVAHPVFPCAVPSLREFVEDLRIDPAVVVDGVGVAGLFDLSGGTIRAEIRHNGAGVAIFESPVSAGATLELRSIGEGFSDSVPLSEAAWIVVSNVGGNPDDRDADFLLNYLVSGAIPENALILDHPLNCPLQHRKVHPFFSIGPGCSNTQYP